tara:strand:+ start:1021 stop:1605 length:585 start_codon:yes stop_codon:yes gene_type:complete
MNKKIFKFFLVFFLTFQTESFATNPSDFVQSAVNRASEILKQNISKEEKMEKIELIAEEVVDIKGIAYYSLGSHRKTLSSEKKEEYFKVFKKYFLKSFSSRLAQYSDPKIQVSSEKKLNEKYTIVSSILLATEKTPQVKLDWRIVTKDIHKPLIIDVVIEGVSLARVQREEFNSIIQNSNIDGLINNLNEFANK